MATLEQTPRNATHWSRTSMAHRSDKFKLSTDPLFVEKVIDVVAPPVVRGLAGLEFRADIGDVLALGQRPVGLGE
ncbi:hypothetical protein EV192_104325 [Actinocrispum wychmicini]|uniref:Uncharacterized protein n=1 Tax=Actinocrispum wychmicini TaxID=1213861 RepID=A0A4R2JHX1_9PSEU|nr:hypothetical protein EV192_104325 [Actinocrispum wychmicini]